MINISTVNEHFGAQVRKGRKAKGWSQAELAKEIGVSRDTTVSSWERGEKTPKFDMLVKLAKMFDVSVDSLLGNDAKEKTYLDVLNLSSKEDVLAKYDFVIDGKTLTPEQALRLVAYVRAERQIDNN